MDKIQINIPEGFEIDQDKSNFSKGIIEFKPVEEKKLNYGDIAEELFLNNSGFYLDENGMVKVTNRFNTTTNDPNNATSKEQLECLMAYNKLRNVAEYLNKGWKGDWCNESLHWFLYYKDKESKIKIEFNTTFHSSSVYFSSKKLAEQAIEILGEEEIKKALFIY